MQTIEPASTGVATSETAAILLMIERMARDPTADMDKFERAMAAYERMAARAKEEAFNAAMSAAQAEMPQVARDKDNDHTRSRYATLEAICAAATPVYTKHGFSLSFGPERSPLDGHYRITCIASNAGHSRRYEADLPPDIAGLQGKVNKTPIQAFGSTMSYGRRYLICLIFNIAIKGEDDDGVAAGRGPTISEDQVVILRDMLKVICTKQKTDLIPSIIKLGQALGLQIEKLEEIPVDKFDEAKRLLDETLGKSK